MKTNITSAWRRFWFTPGPYFDLAVLRVLFVGLQCFLLLNRVDGLVYAVNLPAELYDPLYAIRVLTLSWNPDAAPPAAAVYAVYGVTLLAGAMSFLGIFTNVALWVFALGSIFFSGFKYSFGDFHHPEAAMMMALVALALAPCGKVLSVDSLWKRRRGAGMADRSVGLLDYAGPYAYWPIRLIQWYYPLMYLSAGLGKLNRGGLDWANGFTLQYYMIQDYYRWGSPIALWLSKQHTMLQVGQWFVIAFQLTFFLILFFPRLRWVYLPAGLIFHLTIWFAMRATFPEWICLYAVYIPWAYVLKSLADGRIIVREPAVALSRT